MQKIIDMGEPDESRKEKKMKSIKKNAILSAIKVLMSMFFPLISFPYASRVLGPSGIGKVDFSTSVVAYFMLFASLGISTYGIRQGAKYRDDKQKLSTFVQEILIINIVTTIISYAVFGIMLVTVPQFKPYVFVLLISGLQIGFTTLGIDWLYGALEEYAYITIRSVVFQALALVLLFVLVKDSDDYLQYAFVQVFAAVGSNLLNLIHARKFITIKKSMPYDFTRHFKPILVIFGLNLASNIYMNLDKTMLGLLCGDVEVGLYGAALKMNRIVLQLILSIGTVVVARLSFYYAKGAFQKYQTLFLKVMNSVLFIAIPAALGLCVLSRETLYVLSGEKYVSASLTSQILTLTIIIIGISNLMSVQVFIPMEKEKYSLYASCSAAVINAGLNYILIPKFGKEGAAVSTVLAEIVALLICAYFSRKYICYTGILHNLLQFVVSAVFIVPVYFGIKCLTDNPFIILIATTISGGLLYGVILLVFKNQIAMQLIDMIKNKMKVRKV